MRLVIHLRTPDPTPTEEPHVIRRGRGRPPKPKPEPESGGIGIFHNKAQRQAEPVVLRGRGRPRKHSILDDAVDDKVNKSPNLLSFLPKQAISKKPRTKTKLVRMLMATAAPDHHHYDTSSSLSASSNSIESCVSNPTPPSECTCFAPLSELEIPDPFPDLYSLYWDENIFKNFFEGIPNGNDDDLAHGGWCSFCREMKE